MLNAVATPRANGQVERYNRTILASLAVKNHNCKENEWDKHLEEIQLGLNTTLNKGIGKSPAEVLFGLRLRTKGDGIVASLLDKNQDGANQSLEAIRNEVSSKVCEEQEKQKHRFDKSRKAAREFKVGDLVRIERDISSNNGKSKKLLPKLQGPYRIVKVLLNDRYVVEDTPLTRKQNKRYEGIISVDKIHPWLAFTQEYLMDSDKDSSADNDEMESRDNECSVNNNEVESRDDDNEIESVDDDNESAD